MSNHISPYVGGMPPAQPPEKEEAPDENQEPSDSEIRELEEKKSYS